MIGLSKRERKEKIYLVISFPLNRKTKRDKKRRTEGGGAKRGRGEKGKTERLKEKREKQRETDRDNERG